MVVSSTTDTGQSSQTEQKDILKSDFLKLFITQLRFQDPLNPLDGKDMTAQLAQFSALEQLHNIGTYMRDLLLFQNSLQNTLIVGLIGKEVEIEGNTVYLDDSAEIDFYLQSNAQRVKISIYDSSGALVREVELQNCQAGENTYTWDGLDNEGNPLEAGEYEVSIEAYDEEGQPVEVQVYTSAQVTGITFKDNITYLVLDNGQMVQLNEIISIGG